MAIDFMADAEALRDELMIAAVIFTVIRNWRLRSIARRASSPTN